MARPQVVVNVSAALPRRGDPTATGTAVLLFAGGSGATTPIRCYTAADAAVYGNSAQATAFAAAVGDALALGAPEVIALRVAGVAADVTESAWTAALNLITDEYGPSAQVAIPGVATTPAHNALMAHAAANPSRTVFIDAAPDATATALATLATSFAASAGAPRAALVAPHVTFPAAANATRTVPGSVIAAGLAARGDAVVGHANNAPAGDQGRGAGVVTGGLAPTAVFTNAEMDTLHEAGVSVIKQRLGVPTLYGWRSLSNDERFRQLNAGRFSGQLASGIGAVMNQFLFRQIDGQGLLFSEVEGALRGYLLPKWAQQALFGATAADAFDVQVRSVNTAATIKAGEVHAAVAVRLTPHTEKVVIDVVTNIAQES